MYEVGVLMIELTCSDRLRRWYLFFELLIIAPNTRRNVSFDFNMIDCVIFLRYKVVGFPV